MSTRRRGRRPARVDVAAYLIEAGADVDKWDLYGRSPIYMAADVSTLPVMGNGAMVVIPSEDQPTALDIARMLLDAGANPNLQLRRPPYRNVPPHRGGDGLLSQGATALLPAARAGDAEFAAILLSDPRTMVDLPNDDGITPLMAAAGMDFGARVTRGHNRTDEQVLATMRVLLDAGAVEGLAAAGSAAPDAPPDSETVTLLERLMNEQGLSTAPPAEAPRQPGR